MQNEILDPGPLHAADGRLARVGFSRRPLLVYDPARVRVPGFGPFGRLRIKEWDYYGVTSADHFFAASVANVGFIGLVFAYLIDFETNTQVEDTLVTPLGAGCRLPTDSEAGDVLFERRGMRMRFVVTPDRRTLSIAWPRFGRGAGLQADLELTHQPRGESMVIATPMERLGFYYNRKTPAMPTRGRVVLGGRVRELDPASSFTTLDWGRGVWPYHTFWNWASASGRLADGRAFGLNLGKGFGDLSAATENAVFVDGRLSKLGGVEFEYNPRDFRGEWRFCDDEGRLSLTMRPIFERVTKTDFLLARSEVHQVFGRWNGRVTTDAGESIEVPGIVGWAEEHRARW